MKLSRHLCLARQVVHRQLIAALEGDRANGLQRGLAARDSAQASSPQPDDSSAAGMLRHAQLAEVAARVNVMHRQAKRAQKDCSDLHLLLLLHRRAADILRRRAGGCTDLSQGFSDTSAEIACVMQASPQAPIKHPIAAASHVWRQFCEFCRAM